MAYPHAQLYPNWDPSQGLELWASFQKVASLNLSTGGSASEQPFT